MPCHGRTTATATMPWKNGTRHPLVFLLPRLLRPNFTFVPPFSLIFPQGLIELTVRIIQTNDKLEWTLVQGDSDGYGVKFITESPRAVVVKEFVHRKHRTLEPHHQTSHLPKDRLTLLMCLRLVTRPVVGVGHERGRPGVGPQSWCTTLMTMHDLHFTSQTDMHDTRLPLST